MNGSFEATKFKAKMYNDYNNVTTEKFCFESGDVIRLLHKEAHGYLTTHGRDIEITLPMMPDYLDR